MGMPGQPPMGMQPQMKQPKPPKKPMSKGAKIGIIAGIAAVVVALLVVFVVIPLIKKSKSSDLQGLYAYEGSWGDMYIVFDNGTYIAYNDEELEDIWEAGYYTIDGDSVELYNLDDDRERCTFDKSSNEIEIDDDVYKCKDKSVKLDGISIDENYMENLEKKIKTAIDTTLGYEKAYECATSYGYFYFTENDLDQQHLDNDFEIYFAECLDYKNDKTLIELMEKGYIHLDIYFYLDGSYDLYIEAYDSMF